MISTACNAGGFGSMAFGAGPFGTGSNLEIADARAETVNTVLVTFTTPPAMSDPATFWDALRPQNWTLTAYDPLTAKVRLAQFVERVDAFTARVWFDGPLDSLAYYRIDVENVQDLYGVLMLTACASFVFRAFERRRKEIFSGPGETNAVDIANPQSSSDDPNQEANLGTFVINDQGDIGVEGGRAYLRKRVLRRATTAVGGFFHLPNYGFLPGIKGTITPGLFRKIQGAAVTQILQEPDVVDCSVTVAALPNDPSVVFLTIKVRDNLGNEETLSTPVNFAP